VQLEALEMLSSMSEGRLKGLLDILPKESTESFRPQLIEIKRIFEDTNVESSDGKKIRVVDKPLLILVVLL